MSSRTSSTWNGSSASSSSRGHRRPTRLPRALAEALALWRGDPLADLGDAPFATVDAALLEEARLAALERRIELDQEAGKHAALVPELERLVASYPLRERLACLLVTALYRSGRQADALDAQRRARRHLVDELGIEPGPELQRLEQAILTHDPALAAPPARASATLATLPASPTPLVGRRLELAAVTALLRRADVRLLTLTGPGGTGKTRLALEAAWKLAREHPDGAVFVDLAPLDDPELVAPTIARALGIRESGEAIVGAAVGALRGRTLLLVLDNFERVNDAALVVSELLAGAPGLTVLVTSRAVLHLSGEHAYAVPPLRLPAGVDVRDLEALARNEAVSLFVARAKAASHGFELTPGNASAVAEICVALDGLPLALELAAAHCRRLSAPVLLARLARKLELLTDGPRDRPARQRTLRAAIQWSYELLESDEREVFARLGVFSGGCTESAAAAVCDAKAHELERLVAQSLLRRDDEPDGESRYQMLETVREFALEQLIAEGAEGRPGATRRAFSASGRASRSRAVEPDPGPVSRPLARTGCGRRRQHARGTRVG